MTEQELTERMAPVIHLASYQIRDMTHEEAVRVMSASVAGLFMTFLPKEAYVQALSMAAHFMAVVLGVPLVGLAIPTDEPPQEAAEPEPRNAESKVTMH